MPIKLTLYSLFSIFKICGIKFLKNYFSYRLCWLLNGLKFEQKSKYALKAYADIKAGRIGIAAVFF